MNGIGARRKLDGAQAGRAVAALMVVVFHANVFVLPERLYDGVAASRAFNMGYSGVEFFFVLSGFIMFHVHARDFSQPGRAGDFLRRRFVRIYPIYWIVLAVLIALYMSAPERGPANARDPEAILTSLLLFPMPEPPIMRVAWTLQHEMLFYLVFVLSILNFRAGAFIFGLWMVGCGAAAASGWKAYPFDFLLSAYNLLFLFGMGAAVLWRRLSVGQARLLFWLGLSLFLFTGLSEAYGLVDWTKAVRTLSFGAGAAAIAAALAGGALAPPRWLTFLGDASYSIYLLHLPAMLVLSSVLAKFGAPWNVPPILSLIVLTTFSAVAGCWVHVFIEKPVLARLSSVRRVDARPGQQA